MSKCKACSGKGRTTIWTEDKGAFVSMRCLVCGGTGEVRTK